MRVLYACHQFFPRHYTGTERYTLALAKQMQALGHHVEVSTHACADPDGLRPSPTPGVLWARYAHERVLVTAWRHEAHDDAGLRGVSARVGDPSLESAFDRFLQDHPFDVLHATHLMRQTPLIRVARRRGMATVLELTDFWTVCPRGTLLRSDGALCESPDGGRVCAERCYGRRWQALLRTRYDHAVEEIERADLVIAPSRFLHGVFDRLGVDTGRFIDRTYSFDLTAIRGGHRAPAGRPRRPLTFGFLGTLLPHKGVDVLVKAFRMLDAPQVRLRLYGSVLDRVDYQRVLHTLRGDDPRIEMCGEYEYGRLGEILDGLDAVVVPSVWYENNPLVVGVCHAAGVPVIVTDLGGMTEMVTDGVDGLTFRRGDHVDLAAKLQAVVDDPQILSRLAERITPPPRVEGDAVEMEAIYRALLDGTAIDAPTD